MKKRLVLLAMILVANFAGGCGMFGGAKTYDGSEAYSEAHPDQATRPPYMDPDNQYSSDNK